MAGLNGAFVDKSIIFEGILLVLVYREKEQAPSRTALRLSLLTIIMSSKRPSETNRIHKAAGSFKGRLSSFLHLSRAPPSIEVDSSSDNPLQVSASEETLFVSC